MWIGVMKVFDGSIGFWFCLFFIWYLMRMKLWNVVVV